MAEHVIAVSTYGSHRVKNAHTGQMVSAQKIGYSSAASAVLLALYGDRARDVSSKQASYHYIQIDAEVTVRHGYILLKVSDAELGKRGSDHPSDAPSGGLSLAATMPGSSFRA
jgi:hypothetical protein